jgi:hypothetical protein
MHWTLAALAIFTGCMRTDPVDLPRCGDRTCSLGESVWSYPQDCAPPPPVAPRPPACPLASVLGGAPVDVTGTTTGASTAPDLAPCGDRVASPLADYTWTTPVSGRYEIAVHAAFTAVVDVRAGDCRGDELACHVASDTVVDRVLGAGQLVDIAIAGAGGASGTYELDITRLPDACGDGACEASEDSRSCPADCRTSTCGDGVCDVGESCAADCAAAACGNGICEPGEDAASCPLDCTTTCGNGVCEVGEELACSLDCNVCGDGICGAGEACPTDCDVGGDTCGDGVCSGTETSASCPTDCGVGRDTCGDGVCGGTETSTSCPGDCNIETCGDGTCDAGETSESCPSDCAAPSSADTDGSTREQREQLRSSGEVGSARLADELHAAGALR